MNKLREIFRKDQPILPWAAVQECDSSGNCYDTGSGDIPPVHEPQPPSTQRLPGQEPPGRDRDRPTDLVTAFLALFTAQPALA